jgi:hypothetical protein
MFSISPGTLGFPVAHNCSPVQRDVLLGDLFFLIDLRGRLIRSLQNQLLVSFLYFLRPCGRAYPKERIVVNTYGFVSSLTLLPSK